MKFALICENAPGGDSALCSRDRRAKCVAAATPWASAEAAGRALDLALRDPVWRKYRWKIKMHNTEVTCDE